MVNHDWRPLFDILLDLQGQGFAGAYFNYADAVENALRSGEVPVRARRSYSAAFERIDGRIAGDCRISLFSLNRGEIYEGATIERALFVNVEADADKVKAYIRANCLPGERAGEGAPKRRGGRPPKYDWAALRQETLRLMNHHGDFDVSDPDWDCQARLENAPSNFCNKRGWVEEPSPTSLREHIPLWLDEWRKEKVGN